MGRPKSINVFATEGGITLIKCKNCSFSIDLEDLNKVKNYYWFDKFCKSTNTYYGYAHFSGNKKISLHRTILNVTDSNVCVDHKNGDTTDNRKENLRICSKLENNRNVKKRKNCKSIYKGLTLRPSGRWGVYIKSETENICLGTFDSEIDAAKEYNIAATKLFGKFAKLNVIKEKNEQK